MICSVVKKMEREKAIAFEEEHLQDVKTKVGLGSRNPEVNVSDGISDYLGSGMI